MSQLEDFDSYFSLKGKVAVVTGGSRGLGLHAATGLIYAGVNTLVITSRKADACESAVKALQSRFPSAVISAIPADLSKPTEVTRFVTAVGVITDKVHILIANAGATWGAPFESHPDEAFAKVMDLNVRSIFNLIRDISPLLRAAATPTDPARIITVGSVFGIRIGTVGDHATYGYAASKAAVHHMTQHLAVALAPKGILVNAIAPGLFPTKMTAGLIGGEEYFADLSPNGRLGKPDDIVGAIVYLTSRAGSHINGAILPIDGGSHLVSKL